MQIRRWHRPGWFAVLLTLAGVAFFVCLGVWQVDRAHQKIRLFAEFAGAAQQKPVTLDEARRAVIPSRYPLVRVSGHYDATHAYVLDNQSRDGHSGVMVFDVFEPDDGGNALLVNRGFLARDAQDRDPAPPAPPQGGRILTGLYAPPPGSGLRLGGDALARQKTWPKTSIYIDLDEIARDLRQPLDPRVLLLLPASGSAFVREWKPQVFPPARHYGYALTWFTFAFVAVVMFVILHWRVPENTR